MLSTNNKSKQMKVIGLVGIFLWKLLHPSANAENTIKVSIYAIGVTIRSICDFAKHLLFSKSNRG